MVITCTSPTPHFASGCELLLHYDADNDGLINLDELNQSYSDYENGIITKEEFDFVSDAYINEYAVFELSLQAGWNAISLPLVPVNPKAGDVFALFEKTEFGAWTCYYIEANNWVSIGRDIIVEPGVGYFLNIPEPITLLLFGTLIHEVPRMHVYPVGELVGWFLIGTPYGGVKIKEVIAPSLNYGDPDAGYDIGITTTEVAPSGRTLLTKEYMLETGKGYYLGTNVDTYFGPLKTVTFESVPDGATVTVDGKQGGL